MNEDMLRMLAALTVTFSGKGWQEMSPSSLSKHRRNLKKFVQFMQPMTMMVMQL